MASVRVLDLRCGADYRAHALHGEDRIWVEKNCYIDVWIELLHALGLDPVAALSVALAVDFEGDQWTFFKPSHDELRALYGLEVQELNVWRPLWQHAVEHLGAGKLISTEADAYWLPDTAGTDYRTQHAKTTIVLNEFDLQAQNLGYFHNGGYHRLQGEDFVRTFRLDEPADAPFLPLYAEFVRIDRIVRRDPGQLRSLARERMHHALARRPQRNPIERFWGRFEQELPRLQAAGLSAYHAWAFATLRQLGAAFELVALQVRWIDLGHDSTAAAAFERIAHHSKTLILKVARAVNSGRSLDVRGQFDDMAQAWEQGMQALAAGVARQR